MSEQIEDTLSQNDNETIASLQSTYSLTSCSNDSYLSSIDRLNELVPNAIQYDNTEQESTERSAKSKNSFSKRFCTIFQTAVLRRCSPKFYIAIPVLLLIVIVFIIALIVWLFNSAVPQNLHSDTISNSTSNESDFRIILRHEWDAKSPKAAAEPLKNQPPQLVIIHHTYTGLCYFQKQCSTYVRAIQRNHMEVTCHWNDIGYNFLVGGDGLVYEGRGWNVVGAHTKGYNPWSIGIGIIGSFEKEIPTKVQLEATQKLIEYGVENGYISSKYKLLGHRQCLDSKDPGMALYNIIMTWKHWSPMCPKIGIER